MISVDGDWDDSDDDDDDASELLCCIGSLGLIPSKSEPSNASSILY